MHLIEVSPALQQRQGETLRGGEGLVPTYRDIPDAAPAGPAIILANAKYLPGAISANTLLRPMNALLLLGLGLGGGPIARLLSTRPLVYLGKASYAMYILHIPILWWAVGWPSFMVRYFYVLIVLAVSCVTYSLFEEPANRWLRGLTGFRPASQSASADQHRASPARQEAA